MHVSGSKYERNDNRLKIQICTSLINTLVLFIHLYISVKFDGSKRNFFGDFIYKLFYVHMVKYFVKQSDYHYHHFGIS